MKSSATPSHHQRQRSMGNIHHLMPLPTPHGGFNRMSLTSDVVSTIGLNNDGSSSGDPLAGSSGPTGGASISGLHDTKRAIDHLKSVTGIVLLSLYIYMKIIEILCNTRPVAPDWMGRRLCSPPPPHIWSAQWKKMALTAAAYFFLLVDVDNV